jgi:hypothetical protein
LPGELGGQRLAARLAALASAHEQRRVLPVKAYVTPLHADQLGSAKPGQHKRHQHESVALDEPRPAPLWSLGGGEHRLELLVREPVSEHTAANHVRGILRKTACANRTQATAYAYRPRPG